MRGCTTIFTDEWIELRNHKEREVKSGINVILDKSDEHYITVYLDGLHNVPVMFEYKRGGTTILLHAALPEDYDCTVDGKMAKIAEVIANAEIIYERIQEYQVVYLQNAIDEFNLAVKKISSIEENIVKDILEKKELL